MSLAAGQIANEDDLAAIVDGSIEKPIGRLVASGTQTLTDNTQVAITFTAEDFDTHLFHSTSSNTSRVTPTVPGYYRFLGTVFYGTETTPVVADASIRFNGSTNLAHADRKVPTTVQFSLRCSALIAMNGTTDYIELMGRQDSSGNISTNQSLQFSSCLEWEFIRGL
jgi:hypothetical protein